MSRLEFVRRDKYRVIFLVLLTLALPFMADWHNPAGVQPIAIFGFLAAIGWMGLIPLLLGPDSWRAEYFGDWQ